MSIFKINSFFPGYSQGVIMSVNDTEMYVMENKKQNNEDDDNSKDVASQELDLLPEERCCCSALQHLVSPYIFGVLACLISFLQAAASTGTG